MQQLLPDALHLIQRDSRRSRNVDHERHPELIALPAAATAIQVQSSCARRRAGDKLAGHHNRMPPVADHLHLKGVAVSGADPWSNTSVAP